jgi:small subunit ribosomal protein S6
MSLKATQGELIKELERRLKVTDAVIKYMTIRLDEEIKRQQKLAARREQRSRRRPKRPAPAPPGAPAGPAPSQGEPAAAAG